MHRLTLASLLLPYLSLLGLSRALPAQPSLLPRMCTVELPTYLAFVETRDPSRPAINGSYFLAWKDANGSEVESFLEFSSIPASAWGCQLELFFPKGYWALLGMGGGTNRLYVYRVTLPLPPHFDWKTAPKPTYLFGVTPQLPTDRTVQQDIKIIINSAICEPKMGFRVAIAPEAVQGGVEFWTENTFPNMGFRLTHNC